MRIWYVTSTLATRARFFELLPVRVNGFATLLTSAYKEAVKWGTIFRRGRGTSTCRMGELCRVRCVLEEEAVQTLAGITASR